VRLFSRVLRRYFRQLSSGERDFDGSKIHKFVPRGINGRYAKFMVNGRRKYQLEHEANIIELLAHARDCKMTDPRDRVFALIGLANSGYKIMPDYTMDVAAVFQQSTKQILLHDRSLNVLTCCCGDFEEIMRRTDIPSWTPDWSTPSLFDFIYDPINDYPPFRAASDYPPIPGLVSLNGRPDSILRVQCLVIDQLAMNESLISIPNDDDSRTVEDWECIAGFSDDSARFAPYVDGSCSMEDAFLNVIVRDRARYDQGTDIDQLLTIHISDAREDGRFFRSPKGYLGITKGVHDLRHTDSICILLGVNVPFILRQADDHYILISDTYVEGLMYGEAIKMMRQGIFEVCTINIH